MDKTVFKGTLLVGLSGLLYGVLGYLGTLILKDDFSITTMLFWRFFIAFLWMLFFTGCSFLFRQSHAISQTHSFWPRFLMLSLAVLSYCGSSLFYFLACVETGTGVAMVIFFAYPVFVVLFSYILGNWKLNKHAFAALTAVIIGLFLLKEPTEGSLQTLGIAFGLIASFAYAIYVFSGQFSIKMMNSKNQILLLTLGNALVFLLMSLLTHTFKFPQNSHTWLNILGIGIIATAIPMQLLLDGLKYVSPVKASILSVLEPVTTVVLGFLLLNEIVSVMQTIGIIVILFGAMLIQFEKRAAQVLVEEKSDL